MIRYFHGFNVYSLYTLILYIYIYIYIYIIYIVKPRSHQKIEPEREIYFYSLQISTAYWLYIISFHLLARYLVNVIKQKFEAAGKIWLYTLVRTQLYAKYIIFIILIKIYTYIHIRI